MTVPVLLRGLRKRAKVPAALLGCAAFLTLNVLVLTGLVGRWGQWYSDSLAYRGQTEALLHGSIALDIDPRGVTWDRAWGTGGVQQVWGLGVPAWQLPFEISARVFGRSAFPDRLEFGVALLLVAYLVMRAFLTSNTIRNPLKYVWRRPESVSAVPVLLLFPAFLTLCRTKFSVYEEAEAYSYLASIALLAATISFTRQPTLSRFRLLCLFSGLAAFIRPTLFVYGLASLLMAIMSARRAGWRIGSMAMGVTLFGMGCLLLFVTNLERFGSGFEFGHQLTLNGIDEMRFASRFDDPFRAEPIGSASVELFSSLFLLGNTFNSFDWYSRGFFAGQSSTFRWREFYFRTFDLSILVVVCTAWMLTAWQRWRWRRRQETPGEGSEARALSLWSLLSTIPLVLFYLRFPFITSRYLLDFAPAFAAGFLGALFAIFGRLPSAGTRAYVVRCVLYLSLALWWVYEVHAPEILLGSPQALTYSELKARVSDDSAPSRPLPNEYRIKMNLADYGIPFNGIGWDSDTGETNASIAIFVSDPDRLELEVAPVEDAKVTPADYEHVQAKIGLELLTLETSKDTPAGRLLIFRGPQSKVYQRGTQVAFIGFVAPADLAVGASKLRLLRVRWR